MTTGIRSDASGTFGALTFGGDDVLRFGSDNSGQLAGFRNKIINGNFGIWQRYSASTGPGFLADRWNVYVTSLQDRVALSLADQELTGSSYALQMYVNAGAVCRALQPIESVTTLASKKATLSFWAKGPSGEAVEVYLTQNFGSGGSTTVNVNRAVTPATFSTTFQKHTITFDIPSVVGKTLGTANYLGVQIGKGAGASGNVLITAVQLEEGSIATPFEQRPIGLELSLCQRYYQKIGGEAQYDILLQGHASGAGSAAGFTMTLPNSMRSSPTSTKVGTWNVQNCGQPSIGASTNSMTISTIATAAGAVQVNTTGSSTYVTLAAEL